MSDKSDFTILQPGMVVNGYLIERELGRGAMAVVYLTRQLDLNRPVALKVMSSEFALKKDYVRRFFNEVRTAAALSHPNIIQAYDAGVAFNHTYYFAMEYVEGESMLRKIEENGPIPIPEALNYAREIAAALDYGWQQKRFRHGDIKPENFMVQKNGHVKLADFGLAMVKGHEYQGNEVMLTPHYAAPELIRGLRSPEACLTDIYAFGASLYHMLAGSTPYPGNDAREVMRCHLNKKVEPLHHRNPAVPGYLSDFVDSMMAKDPRKRIQDWKMVLNGIEAVSEKFHAGRKNLHSHVSAGEPAGNKEVLDFRERQKQYLLRHRQAEAYWRYRRHQASGIWLKVGSAVLTGLVLLALLWGLYRWMNSHRQSDGNAGRQVVSSASAPKKSAAEVTQADFRADIPEKDKAAKASEKSSAAEPAENIDQKELSGVSGEEDASGAEKAVPVMIRTQVAGKSISAAGQDQDIAEFLKQSEMPDSPSPVTVLQLPDRSIPLPADPESLDGLYLTELQILLHQTDYSFGKMKEIEKLQKNVTVWQKHHPQVRGLTKHVLHYILNQMGPMLEAYPAYLMRMEPGLASGKFHIQNRHTPWYRIIQIQLDGILLEQVFSKGRIRLPLKTWAELEKNGLLRNILIQAYRRDSGGDRSLRLFHYFLFRGEYQECRLMIRKAPNAYQHVLAVILGLHALNPRERRSLEMFQDLLMVHKMGSRAMLGHLLNDFQYQNTSIVRRNRKLCDFWQQQCRMSVSGNAGASLIAEAVKLGSGYPERAMNLLVRAEGIFPGKYPEAAMIPQISQKIFQPDKNGAFSIRAFSDCPFRDYNAKCNPLSRWQKTVACEGFNDAFSKYYRLFARAEQGVDRQKFLAAECPGNLSPELKTYWLFARAVHEIGALHEKSGQEFKTLFFSSDRDVRHCGHLLMEYLLLLHRNSLYTANYNLNLYDFLKLIDPGKKIAPHHLRFWKLSLAVKLEFRQFSEVKNDIEEFCRKFDAAGTDIPVENLHVLQKMKRVLHLIRRHEFEESGLLQQFLIHSRNISAEDLRLFLACCGSARLGNKADQSFFRWYDQNGRSLDLLGGNIVYEFTLRRVGHALSMGDVVSALKIVNRALEMRPVHLWLYFARLHFLRGGLLALGNSYGALVDSASLIANSAWAGHAEKKVILVNPGERTVRISAVARGNYLCFWEDWLRVCARQESHSDCLESDFTIGKDAMKAEAVLMEGLRSFYEHRKSVKNINWSKEF